VSIALCRRIWDRGPKGNGRFLLLCIGDHADESGHAWPSLERLAERCTLTKRSVISTLNLLEKDGWLKRIKKGRKSEYQIVLAKLGIGEVTSSTTIPTGEEHSHKTSENASPVQTPIGEVERSEKVKSTAAIGEISCNPPTPPYRRTTKEPPVEPTAERITEAIGEIVETAHLLPAEPVMQALATAIQGELRNGSALEDLTPRILSVWSKYSTARDRGKFEIRGWSPARFFAEGHWRDEQSWPWKPEHRPERPVRYVDPTRLYDGPEYQPAALARSHDAAKSAVFSPANPPQNSQTQKVNA
jgi:hypothetical protein